MCVCVCVFVFVLFVGGCLCVCVLLTSIDGAKRLANERDLRMTTLSYTLGPVFLHVGTR